MSTVFASAHGAETGICRLGADPGPSEPPRVFATCCQERGRCVPTEVLERTLDDDAALLGQRDCADAQTLCVDARWLEDVPPVAAECRSLGDIEGRCVSRCVTQAEGADGLPRSSCSADEVCAPCYDPLTARHEGMTTRQAAPKTRR